MAAQMTRLVGQNAAVRKYDILTAIAIASLQDGPLTPTQGLRLVAMITAYYDWARDEVAIGQDALMRLWGVSKRTVIRDLAVFRALGVLHLISAGRRGRVAVHRLGHDRIDALRSADWSRAGTAFAKRMAATSEVVRDTEQPTQATSDASSDAPLWGVVKARLADALAPAAMERWIAPLWLEGEGGPVLRISAPTRFHAAYVEREHGDRIAVAAALALGHPVRLAITERRRG